MSTHNAWKQPRLMTAEEAQELPPEAPLAELARVRPEYQEMVYTLLMGEALALAARMHGGRY